MLSERFWSKVDRSHSKECWVWVGAKTNQGYGLFNILGTNKIASRLVYEDAIGPIPSEAIVCHQCNNPSCVNPNHLFLKIRAFNH